jgi:UDP-glucose 4-epimerase
VNGSYVLLGGSGVLGTGFRTALDRSGADVVRLRPRWDRGGAAAAALESTLVPLVGRRSSTTVVWAAGIGNIGAGTDAMRRETATVRSLCHVVAGLPAIQRRRVSVLFASSAGALFGGQGHSEVSETDRPCPTTPYGRQKLVQEEVLRGFAADTECRVLICRYSNLYGLADGRVTPRGLISTAVRAARTRQPMVVYVSPDTRRDHIYNVDAAVESLSLLSSSLAGANTMLVREGETRAVAEILALVGRVSGRRVPATYAERPDTRLQPKVLRFERPKRGIRHLRRTPMEVAIHRMLRAPMEI